MWSVLLRVAPPTGAWCRSFAVPRGDSSLRVLSCFPGRSGSCVELVELAGPGWRRNLESVRDKVGAEGVEVLEERPSSAVARISGPGCGLPVAVADSGVAPLFPISMEDGYDLWLLLTTPTRAARFLESIRSLGVNAEIVHAGEYTPSHGLTARQREVLAAAVREGYYDFPRRITLTDLAGNMGVTKSTLWELLMVVEREVMRDAAEAAGLFAAPPGRPMPPRERATNGGRAPKVEATQPTARVEP